MQSSICWGAGHLVNINDVAGPYSGILFGVSNTIATLPGIISPYLVGLITAQVSINTCRTRIDNKFILIFCCSFLKKQTQNEWKLVFYICAAITFLGGVVYVLFCDGNLQDWATNSTPTKKETQPVKEESVTSL